MGKWIHFSKFCKKWVVFRSPNELKLAKAFSSVTSDDKKKSYTKSFPKSVSNSSFPFTTKLPIDINSGKSSTTEITQSELCQKCRRAVDRYSKCSGRFNFWIFSPHIHKLLLLDQKECPWIPAVNATFGLVMIKPKVAGKIYHFECLTCVSCACSLPKELVFEVLWSLPKSY